MERWRKKEGEGKGEMKRWVGKGVGGGGYTLESTVGRVLSISLYFNIF